MCEAFSPKGHAGLSRSNFVMPPALSEVTEALKSQVVIASHSMDGLQVSLENLLNPSAICRSPVGSVYASGPIQNHTMCATGR